LPTIDVEGRAGQALLVMMCIPLLIIAPISSNLIKPEAPRRNLLDERIEWYQLDGFRSEVFRTWRHALQQRSQQTLDELRPFQSHGAPAHTALPDALSLSRQFSLANDNHIILLRSASPKQSISEPQRIVSL
jgi:hypothetical protein